jgi:hypothetical protein
MGPDPPGEEAPLKRKTPKGPIAVAQWPSAFTALEKEEFKTQKRVAREGYATRLLVIVPHDDPSAAVAMWTPGLAAFANDFGDIAGLVGSYVKQADGLTKVLANRPSLMKPFKALPHTLQLDIVAVVIKAGSVSKELLRLGLIALRSVHPWWPEAVDPAALQAGQVPSEGLEDLIAAAGRAAAGEGSEDEQRQNGQAAFVEVQGRMEQLPMSILDRESALAHVRTAFKAGAACTSHVLRDSALPCPD